MQNKINLSVVMVSLNEEFNIARVLSSVDWADDIVVYDSGSTDKTVGIAKNMGVNVISGEWLGFGKTKKKATEFAKHDWVLSIDCDEEVSSDLFLEIKNKWSSLNDVVAYKIPRKSFYLNKWINHGGWYPDYQTRFFNKKTSNWNSLNIHEKVEAEKYDFFISSLNHYVFKNIEQHVQTNNKYSSLQAGLMYESGIKFSWFHFLTKPMVKFIECYFIKLGFLDLWPGYFIAYSAGYSVYLKWAKLREMEINKK